METTGSWGLCMGFSSEGREREKVAGKMEEMEEEEKWQDGGR